MTRAERALLVLLAIALPLALVSPVEVVEFGTALEVALVGVTAVIAGLYIVKVGRVARAVSEYLWLLVRRDLRVSFAFGMLLALALLILIPRLLIAADVIDPDTIWVARPWAVVWLAIAINLFAVGLLDDALQMRADRHVQAHVSPVIEPTHNHPEPPSIEERAS